MKIIGKKVFLNIPFEINARMKKYTYVTFKSSIFQKLLLTAKF